MTLEELRQLSKDKENLNERKNIANRLNVCYICGATLVEERVEVLKKPIKRFFGLYLQKTKKWDSRRVCPDNPDHIEIKYNRSYEQR